MSVLITLIKNNDLKSIRDLFIKNPQKIDKIFVSITTGECQGYTAFSLAIWLDRVDVLAIFLQVLGKKQGVEAIKKPVRFGQAEGTALHMAIANVSIATSEFFLNFLESSLSLDEVKKIICQPIKKEASFINLKQIFDMSFFLKEVELSRFLLDRCLEKDKKHENMSIFISKNFVREKKDYVMSWFLMHYNSRPDVDKKINFIISKPYRELSRFFEKQLQSLQFSFGLRAKDLHHAATLPRELCSWIAAYILRDEYPFLTLKFCQFFLESKKPSIKNIGTKSVFFKDVFSSERKQILMEPENDINYRNGLSHQGIKFVN